jgi:hypothetical protein
MSVKSAHRSDVDPPTSRLAAAFLISILVHTVFFGVIQVGNQLHWWDAGPFALFRKMRLSPEELKRLQQPKQEAKEEPALVFVQVTQPSEEVPPETRYYSAASSRAANPEVGDQSQPKIEGRQTQVVRTEDAPNLPTGNPTTPPPTASPPSLETALAEAPQPPPAPESVIRPEEAKLVETAPEPERQPGAGELAVVQPVVPPPDTRPAEPPPIPAPAAMPSVAPTRPETKNEPSPAPAPRSRPRTLVEAKVRQELLSGEKVRQDGGVGRQGPVQLDVVGKSYGAYDEALVFAVKNRWFALLDARRFAGGAAGRVVINFNLFSDGSVRIVEPTESSVDALLEDYCIRAVREPAPFGKWPKEMLREVGKPYREIRFTFYYN